MRCKYTQCYQTQECTASGTDNKKSIVHFLDVDVFCVSFVCEFKLMCLINLICLFCVLACVFLSCIVIQDIISGCSSLQVTTFTLLYLFHIVT